MAGRDPGAHVARRRLGTGLRDLREHANIRIEAAARELECSTAKISRLENGIGPAKIWDVRILLTLYGVEEQSTRRQYEDWARDTKSSGWWESDADLTTEDNDRFFASETVAACIRTYGTPVLPSALQTLDYARAHVRTLFPEWSEVDVDRFAALRHERQAPLLALEDPLQYEAVIDEGAVRRRVGSRETHLRQLTWLADLLEEYEVAKRNHLIVRIIPFSAGPGRALSPFSIFEPRDSRIDPLSAYVEDTVGGHWLESDQADPLISIYDELISLAIDPIGSRRFLRQVIDSL